MGVVGKNSISWGGLAGAPEGATNLAPAAGHRWLGEMLTTAFGLSRQTSSCTSFTLRSMNLRKQSPGHRALRKGRVSLAHHYYLITTVCECRKPYFADAMCATAIASILREKRIWRDSTALCWVLMPDHLHILLQLGCNESLSHLMNRLKSVIAHAVIRRDCDTGRVWMRGFHDRAIRCEEDPWIVARYVLENPIRAGLVGTLEAYPFWDCVWERDVSTW